MMWAEFQPELCSMLVEVIRKTTDESRIFGQKSLVNYNLIVWAHILEETDVCQIIQEHEP